MLKIFVSGVRLKVANWKNFNIPFETVHVGKIPSPKLQAAVVIFLKWCSA